MKWLVIQSDGEHAASRHLRECHAIADGLTRLSQKVDVWGKRHHNFHTAPDFETYDVIFCAEQYEFGFLPDFTKIKNPVKIQWIVDFHVHQGYRAIASGFDMAAHASKPPMCDYPVKKNVWMPNAFDQRHYSKCEPQEKPIEMGFVGSVSQSRKEFIAKLSEDFPGFHCSQIIGNEMMRTIRSMKIHWNQNASFDINYRNFETIGMGTCLLTAHNEHLEKLGFIDGHNCLTFVSYDEAREKARKALETGSWKHVGEAGYLLAADHTYTRRMQDLMKEL